MYAAVLDTCVLWPNLQRDFLLSLAAEGLYRPLWSSAVLKELRLAESTKLRRRGRDPDDASFAADRLVALMRKAFFDAEVSGWERLDGAFGLPDPDDEYLLAAAVVGGAEAVVTSNVRDLPAALVPPPLQIVVPGDFAFDTVAAGPARARAAVREIAQRSGRRSPPRTEAEIRSALRRLYGFDDAANLLES